ncbi:KpsF/GutQ family sugar-phosphate isomerase [Mesobacillus thioparans]|uniref:KpsF/GutQ family sugar-phosphate isomerase n=1 Tax=Mesobacillus thioparans TaxID=370439 RepID=UPI0039EF460E
MANTELGKVDYLETVKRVLEVEAKAITELSSNIDAEKLTQAIQLILDCKGRVVITGMGKSGIIGRKFNATLASTGTPSLFMHPSEGLHGDLGMITKDDVVIMISNSGETEEVLNLLPSIKKIGPKLISIVRNENSTMGQVSDVTLSIGVVEEACPLGLAPTTSTTLTLALGDAIAIALLEAREFTPLDFALYHPSGSLGKKLLLTVGDIISKSGCNPIVKETDSVQDALFQMTTHGAGATAIVNENGNVTGILTDGDVRRAFAKGNVLGEEVINFSSKNPFIVKQTELAFKTLSIMNDNKISALIVADDQKQPIGMLRLHELINAGL